MNDIQHDMVMTAYDNFEIDITLYRTTQPQRVQALLNLETQGYVRVYKLDYGCIGAEITTKGWDYADNIRKNRLPIG